MNFDQLEKRYKANMVEAFDALLKAERDNRPLSLYEEAWSSAESRLTNLTGSMTLAVSIPGQ